MPPLSYTQEGLCRFVVTELGEVAEALAWTDQSLAVQEVVNDVALLLGVDDVALSTDVRALRALSRVTAWRAAVKAVAGRYTFSEENGVKYDRSDLQKLCVAALAVAEAESASPETAPGVKVGSMGAYDPYAAANS